MKQRLASIDLILECRDARVPLTSRNQLFEDLIQGSGKPRAIIYTKKDLASEGGAEGRRVGDLAWTALPSHLSFSSRFGYC
jgi:hypothetical protein